MEFIIGNLFFILLAALIGGVLAHLLKLPSLIGYIVVGFLLSAVLPLEHGAIEGLAEIGIILLLFSVGIELSLSKLSRVGSVAVVGAILQMILVTLILWGIMLGLGLETTPALIMAVGFSLSSTVVVVKMLEDKAETNSIHGEIMVGWLLTQDLAVVPIMALLPTFAANAGEWIGIATSSVLISGFVVCAVFFLGRMFGPLLTHAIASTNSRELLVLGGVSLALGTAFLVSFFGVSPALGAFLAGVVISETQENHAIFSETRPLRDIFVVLFFVTLGFFVSPNILISNFVLILSLALILLIVKSLVIFSLMYFLGYRGKTAITVSLGLAQVGEFSFILFIAAQKIGVLSSEYASIGIATALVTILVTPLLFRLTAPVWRKLRKINIFTTKTEKTKHQIGLNNHVVICGFGRMGSWVGKALEAEEIPFVVIDYNQKVVRKAMKNGVNILYGDPAESGVLDTAGIAQAKAVVVAIPDLVSQEEVISYCQNVSKDIKIIARAHLDSDVAKLSQFQVRRVIQPEFEAALGVVREIFSSMGKSKEDTVKRVQSLRRLHTLNA